MSGQSGACHAQPTAVAAPGGKRIALLGAPNSGKTTLFNALTGLKARVGNYPGVTVARISGKAWTPTGYVTIDDLPGTYSLYPISPDEEVVIDHLAGTLDPESKPDALVLVVDVTTLRRSFAVIVRALSYQLPTLLVLTMTDEFAVRGGQIDVPALARALGLPVVPVVGHRAHGIPALQELLGEPETWRRPPLLPPTDEREQDIWVDSILTAARYEPAQPDRRTSRIDSVLLHPVFGVVVFALVMFGFFQTIFRLAAPLQDKVEQLFGWLGQMAGAHISHELTSRFVSEALIGGVGAVLVFVPQIFLLFLLISILEGVGYLARAAFIMDRAMSVVGLEGRAFVAMLSSLACAIPGIMATRTLPRAADRVATMLSAPLMTCSARLPVYVLLVSMLVPADARVGFFDARGVVMFGLYVLGAVAAMYAAWAVKRGLAHRQAAAPFYMELPPYRMPTFKSLLLSVWRPCSGFVRRAGTVILLATVVVWVLVTLPLRGDEELLEAGTNPADPTAVAAYTTDHSYAASVGRFVEPVFSPLGFEWRTNVGLLASLTAREVFVSTLGTIVKASDPEDPQAELANLKYTDGPDAGKPIFTVPTTGALIVFFAFAMQCMATLATMRREAGSWQMPIFAFLAYFALAWTAAWATRMVLGLFW